STRRSPPSCTAPGATAAPSPPRHCRPTASRWWPTSSAATTPGMPPGSRPRPRRRRSHPDRLLLAQGPGQFVAAHLGPAGQIPLLGDLVELGPGLRGGPAAAVALPDGRRLLPEGLLRPAGKVGQGLLL